MFLLDAVAYAFAFFAILSFLYMVLLTLEVKKVIPDSVYRNRNHEFYQWWKNFSAAAFLLMGAGFTLLTMYRNNFDDSRYFYLVLGIIGVILAFVLLYWVNRKAINLFEPDYLKRLNGPDKSKKKKNENEGDK